MTVLPPSRCVALDSEQVNPETIFDSFQDLLKNLFFCLVETRKIKHFGVLGCHNHCERGLPAQRRLLLMKLPHETRRVTVI